MQAKGRNFNLEDSSLIPTVIKRREPTSLRHSPIDINSVTAAESLTFDLQNPSGEEMKDRMCLPTGPGVSATQG